MTKLKDEYRRSAFLYLIIILILFKLGIDKVAGQDTPTRFQGLLLGAALGDALGGPVEFSEPRLDAFPDLTRPLTEAQRRAWAESLQLRRSERDIHPYGPWIANAPAGTVTDDTRAKLIMLAARLRPGGWTRENLAREILKWHEAGPEPFAELSRANMEEFARAAKWVLGDPLGGLPPDRLWGGIPTMAGQMFFPVVAGKYPGAPEAAYRHVYRINFLDTGMAKDFTAGLTAGLAAALEPGADMSTVLAAMKLTDPFLYGDVPWVPRRFTEWLDRAEGMAEEARGRPDALYRILDRDLGATTHWECWVPVAVGFACGYLAEFDPLATLNLILAYGHDTDSNAQIMGAIFGALHGPDIFPAPWRAQVELRLREDFGVTLAELGAGLTGEVEG